MSLSSPKTITIIRIRISDKKFTLLVRSFAVDLTAVQTAKIVLLNRNTVNRYFGYFRRQVISQAVKERQAELISNGSEEKSSPYLVKTLQNTPKNPSCQIL